MCAIHAPARNDAVPFGDLFISGDLHVGARRMEVSQQLLEGGGATQRLPEHRVDDGDIRRGEPVDQA